MALGAGLEVLFGRWRYQPTAAAELFLYYQQLAEMGHATNCCFWLQDLRHRTAPDDQTKQWLLTQYYPEVAQRFGQPRVVAYLCTPAMHCLVEEIPDYTPP
ncbi:MAG: hypothetical protein EOO60_04590 [Hymenobacter sp.]|nr:MAG: hypothetical protein EOO60_04590 [Hymenobacter sp.]